MMRMHSTRPNYARPVTEEPSAQKRAFSVEMSLQRETTAFSAKQQPSAPNKSLQRQRTAFSARQQPSL
tara:strand:- start:22397 stop:22600 length:204 start_codon:yes stop_codon:yes gene_type:complete